MHSSDCVLGGVDSSCGLSFGARKHRQTHTHTHTVTADASDDTNHASVAAGGGPHVVHLT